MSTISPSLISDAAPDPSTRGEDGGCVEAEILRLFELLLEADRQKLVQRLKQNLPASVTPRAGQTLEAISNALHEKRDVPMEWTVQAFKQVVAEQNISAKSKEVYNAVSYLARRGHIRQVGYGRYVFEGGAGLVTAEDFGLEPGRSDDD